MKHKNHTRKKHGNTNGANDWARPVRVIAHGRLKPGHKTRNGIAQPAVMLRKFAA